MDRCYQVLIVEDEGLFASNVAMQIEQLGSAVVAIVEDSEAALQALDNHSIDLILMDVNIQGSYDGIELAGLIIAREPLPIIFMTSNEDDLTFKRASRTDPAAFLVKPFTDLQLRRTIELCMKKNEDSGLTLSSLENEHLDEEFLFIKKRQKIHKVAVEDIYYLEADGKYCRVCTKSDFYLVRKTLKDMLVRLPASDFTHCHRSYVVNMNKVKFFDLEQDLLFLEERSVPVSKREKEKLLERLKWI